MTARALLHAEVSERGFQGEVMDAAQLLHWRTFHVYDSRRSTAGFPDIVATRGDRLVFAELKTMRGRVSRDQQDWLDALTQVRTVSAHLWRPDSWDAIEAVLR